VPVRFQVDPDFYDHPKVLGMSDAAVSLWTRAGSYSVAKSTDGFVAETVLVHALRSTLEVADELVHRGLWQRRKGGFQFHEWGARNLTRERIEADREADRERKRAARDAARQNGKVLIEGQVVRPDTDRTPSGIQEESDRNPPSSVSVSLSVSESSKNPSSPAPRAKAEDAEFSRFWAVYPRKVGKGEARKVWARLRKQGVDPGELIAGAIRYRDDPKRKPEYTKHPGPWLNAERWTDQLETQSNGAPRGWWDN
jgi:hypothetical protein